MKRWENSSPETTQGQPPLPPLKATNKKINTLKAKVAAHGDRMTRDRGRCFLDAQPVKEEDAQVMTLEWL